MCFAYRTCSIVPIVPLVLALVGSALPAAPAMAKEDGKQAICTVCTVKEGSTHAEDVVAWREYENVRYGLCSEACAKEFDADPAAYVPPTFPRPAPEIGLTDLAGKPVTLESLTGSVVLVDFWATWCAPCRKSMPELEGLQSRHGGRGFTVIGVSIDEGKDARKKVTKFLADRKITYRNVLDATSGAAWERYRVKTVPAAFLLDTEGRIVAQWTGKAPDVADVERHLDTLLRRPD